MERGKQKERQARTGAGRQGERQAVLEAGRGAGRQRDGQADRHRDSGWHGVRQASIERSTERSTETGRAGTKVETESGRHAWRKARTEP